MLEYTSTWYTRSCPRGVDGVRVLPGNTAGGSLEAAATLSASVAARGAGRSDAVARSSVSAANDGITKDEFLALLVAQLKARDILDTGSPAEFVGQLAQLSTVEGIQNLSDRIGAMVTLSAVSQAASMIGKEVAGVDPESDTLVQGKVAGVNVIDGVPMLRVGGASIPLANVVSIS